MLVLAGFNLPDYVQQSTPEHVSSAASDIRDTIQKSFQEALEQQDPIDTGMVLAGGEQAKVDFNNQRP